MWQAGARMFLDRPLTGVGLQDLKAEYPRYRPEGAKESPGHLHSVPVQIAATMGTFGLCAFLWLYGSLLVAAATGLRRDLAAGGLEAGLRLGVLGALAGFAVSGLFEWNFGDEELLYLLFIVTGLAWSARGGASARGEGAAA
jgi:O-antigen ligase